MMQSIPKKHYVKVKRGKSNLYENTRLKSSAFTMKFHVTSTAIDKNDILRLCNILNDSPMYKKNQKEKIRIKPEEIHGGGIRICFLDHPTWYKSVHLHIPIGKWVWVENAVFRPEWKTTKGKEILFEKDTLVTFSLHVCNGALSFTREERLLWQECFLQIGFNLNAQK